MNFFKSHKIEIFIFLLAVFVRIIFFLVCLFQSGGNIENTLHGQDGYFEISRNLLLGNGFSINSSLPFVPYSYGVPGYPFFLFFLLTLTRSYLVTGILQLLLGATIPLIGMRLVQFIMPPHNHIPIIVAVFLALSPYQILFSFVFSTEILFSVLFGVFLISFFNFLKNFSTRNAILVGIFLGLATLVKATTQYIFLLVIMFSLWQFRQEFDKKIILKLGYFFLAFSVVLSPWLYRNYTTFGVINLSSQMPFNLYMTLLPSVFAIENGTGFAEEQKKLVEINPLNLENENSLALSKTLASKAVEEMLKHPTALIKLSVINAITFFTHDGLLTFLQAAGVKPEVYLGKPAIVLFTESPKEFVVTVGDYLKTSMALVFFARLFWIMLTSFFLLGLCHIWRSKNFSREFIFSIIIILYFMLTTLIIGLAVNARFRMPVEPIIFAVSLAGMSVYCCRFKEKFTQIKNKISNGPSCST
mgnify:CR=1 FL=1